MVLKSNLPRNSYVRLRARMADFRSKWHAILTMNPLRTIIRVARRMPHCLKQKGIARMLTPMMLLASVITDFNVILVWELFSDSPNF